jgi:hypothetical protein
MGKSIRPSQIDGRTKPDAKWLHQTLKGVSGKEHLEKKSMDQLKVKFVVLRELRYNFEEDRERRWEEKKQFEEEGFSKISLSYLLLCGNSRGL